MQSRIYNEPSNEVEALATCHRLISHYEQIQAIIPELQKESHEEWEDDAVDKLYQAQTILMHAAAELAKNFDLIVTIAPRPGTEPSEAPAPIPPPAPRSPSRPAPKDRDEDVTACGEVAGVS
jgi:hypothetical protein